MARVNTRLLDTNDPFPDLDLALTTGDVVTLPQDSGSGYAVILFYRGSW